MRILVVVRDRSLAQKIRSWLCDCNCTIHIAPNGDTALQMVGRAKYDRIILDNIGFHQHLRAQGCQSQILLLIPPGEEWQKAIALNAGIKDYLVQPFEVEELKAQLHRLLESETNTSVRINWGRLTLDSIQQQVSYNNSSVKLTALEYSILELFVRSPYQPLSSRAIADRLSISREATTSGLRRLRKKLTNLGTPNDAIATKRGLGYQLTPICRAGAAQSDRFAILDHEITDRQQAEVRQRESAELLQIIIDNLPGGATFIFDRDLRYVLAEGQALSRANFQPADLVGKTVFEALKPDLAELYAEKLRQALAGEGFYHEHEAHGKFYLSRGTPLRSAAAGQSPTLGADPEGEVYGVLVFSYDITDRKRAEATLHASEEKYRSLFNSIDEGFCLIEVLCDERGQSIDYRFLEANPAFEKHTGLANAIGKTARELVPQHETYWFEIYGRIARTGIPERFENAAQELKRFYDVYAFRVGEPQERKVAVLFKDITDRKYHERRQAFLLQLSDALRSLFDAVEIHAAVTRITRNFFGADRCYYCEIIDGNAIIRQDASRDDLPSVAGAYPLSTFPIFKAVVDAGHPFVVRDARTTNLLDEVLQQICCELQVISFIDVPVIKQGKPVGILCITQGTPRNWTELEIELAEEIAERIWVAVTRARAEVALQESEKKLAAELDATQLLHRLATRLVTEDDLQSLYQEIMAAAIALTRADAGTVQILDEATQELLLLATQGLERNMTEHFYRVNVSSNTPCGMALKNGERTFVDFDVPKSTDPDGSMQMHVEAGLLSAQSTPLISRLGKRIGMVSTHWRKHHRPSDGELRFLDLLARQAADAIEQHNTAAALREREELLRTITQAGLWTWEVATGTLNWSPEVYRLHGIDPADEQIDYKGWFDRCLHPEDRAQICEYISQALTTKVSEFEVEFRILHPQLGVRWLLAIARPSFDDWGNITRLSGISIDITDRKQSQIDLQQSEARFAAAFNYAATGMALVDLENKFLQVNQAFCHITGYSKTELIGRDFPSITHPDDIHIDLNYRRQLRGGKIGFFHMEKRYLHKRGHFVWTFLSVSLLRDEQGQPLYFIAQIQDINERKRAESRIQEQAALLDVASDAIFVRDLDNRILYWNRGAEHLYGWTSSEAIGQKANELLQEKDQKIEKILPNVFEAGEWRGEMQKVTKAGAQVTVEGCWSLVKDEAGRPKYILCVNTNITEKKQLEAQFYRAQRLESVGTLASGIAHDLNNVLTPIVAMTKLLLKQSHLDDRSQAMLKLVESSAQKGTETIKRLLSFSKGSQDEGERAPVNLAALLQEAIEICQRTFSKKIAIESKIPDASNCWVSANAAYLHQVLMNLCVNARDAMPNGGTLSLSVKGQFVDEDLVKTNLDAKIGRYVLLTVTDTGTGMPPQVVQRIFDPFFTTKEPGKGTGLGLPMVLRIVKDCGGFLTVSSGEGKGTEFKIYLPALDLPQSNGNAKSEPSEGKVEGILVVDDDVTVLRSTQTLLESNSYKVFSANEGAQALKVYARHRHEIGAIVLDIMMPKMSGIELIEKIREIDARVNIVALSGVPVNREPAIAVGANIFLSKPYTLEDLLESVRAVNR